MERRLYTFAGILAFAAVYFGAARLGLSQAHVNPSASAIWPPTGIALAVIILWGYRLWPGMFLGAFLANLLTQGTVLTSVGVATGNTLEALFGAWLVNRYAGARQVFERATNILLFLLVAGLLSTTLSPTIGVTTLGLGGFADRNRFGEMWFTWWLGDAVGAAVVAPLIVIWVTRARRRITVNQALEGLALLLTVILVCQVVFFGKNPFGDANAPLGYLALLPLIWAAYRFELRGASAASAIIAVIAIWGTVKGHGPFRQPDPGRALLYLQAFIGVVSSTGLVLAAVISERQRAEGRLKTAHADLEVRVNERTAGLTKANAALQAEIAAHKRAEQALVTSQAAFGNFLETAPDAIILVSRDGRIRRVNAQTEQMFGYTRAELDGQRLEVLLPQRYRRSHEGHRQGFFNSPKVRPMGTGLELFGLRKSGDEFPVEISLSPMNTQDGPMVCGTIRDVTERKRLEAEILKISEREQRRIAQDLHDGVGQQLAGIWCLCEVMRKNLSDRSAPDAAEAAKISELLKTALNQTRSLARVLHPIEAEPTGLMSALEAMAASVTGLFHVPCEFRCDPPVLLRDNTVATQLYRIAQEAVTNAVRHGRPSKMEICLSATPEQVTLKVADDGAGFTAAASEGQGMGMRIMNYRASKIGGSLKFQSGNRSGTCVECTLPASGLVEMLEENA